MEAGIDAVGGGLCVMRLDAPFWVFWLGRSLERADPAGKGKRGMIKAFEKSRDRLLSFFEADGGVRLCQQFREGRESVFTGRQMVDYLIDHEIHHRAKIVLALRQWGMEKLPPLNFNPNLAEQSRIGRNAGATCKM